MGFRGNDPRHLRLLYAFNDPLLSVRGFIGEQGVQVLQPRGQEGLHSGQVGGGAGREMAASRIPERIARRREFRAQAPAGAAAAVGGGVPPFAPAPCGGTRIIGASILAYALSASAARGRNTCSHTPLLLQRMGRVWITRKSPNRGGKSRQGISAR